MNDSKVARRLAPIAYAAAAALAWLAAWIAVKTIPLRGGAAQWQAFPDKPWIDGWVRWDAMWYVNIAKDGYWLKPGQQSPVAYFPAYPLGIRALSMVVRNPIVSGTLLTLVFGLVATILFRRWTLAKMEPKSSTVSVLLLLSYPFAFYLYGAIYSDALCLTLALAAFLLLEARRPWLAGIVGAIASATRPVGIAVAVGLAVRAFELAARTVPSTSLGPGLRPPPPKGKGVRGERASFRELVPSAGVLLAPLGLVGYMTYLGVAFGDPLAFVHVMDAPGWAQPPGAETWFKLTFFHDLVHGPGPFIRLRLLVHAAVAVAVFALLIPAWRKFGAGYALYVLVAMGIPTASSKDFVGLGRYALVAFPCFAAAALLLAEKRWLTRVWIAASTAAMLACTAAFAVGIYVS